MSKQCKKNKVVYKDNLFSLYIDIFKYEILLFIKPTFKDVKEVIPKKGLKNLKLTKKVLNNEMRKYAATCFRDSMKTVLILSTLDTLTSTLPHEASHIARHLLTEIGAELDEEVFAYIEGYVSKFFFDSLEEYQLKHSK